MDRQKKFWMYLLFTLLFVYTVKNIFVGADMDEGYGIVVGYRLATGDRLLLEMWEPHQTSAIFTALFIKPFLWITGGNDFLNIYLRLVYFLGQGLLAFYIYRTLRSCVPDLEKETAALLGMCYYLISPKCICIPEYSNLHMWFFALTCIQMVRYYAPGLVDKGNKLYSLSLAGVFLACDVLAYPSMVLLFPVLLGFILRKHIRSRVKECLAFIMPCVLGAILFVGYLLTYMTPSIILQIVPYVLGEGSHQLSFAEKIATWGEGFGIIAAVLVIGAIVSGLICFFRRRINFLFLFYLLQMVYQAFCWVTSENNVGYPQIAFVAVCVMGIFCYYRGGKKSKTGFYLILITGISYFGILLMSNWGPENLNPYLMMGVIGGFLCWNTYSGQLPSEGKGISKYGVPIVSCVIFVLVNAFGGCYRIIDGDVTNNFVFAVRGINYDGVRKGILTPYMTAYRYNKNQEIWAEAVPDGSAVMYVGQSQFYYMLGDCTIASPNTISTPTYDESMLAYWELNPDRYPDVVVVESWFGDIRIFDENSFIGQWLENEFQASRVVEYPYITAYYR